MSSLTRRIQIRALKARGYRRTDFILAMRAGGIERVPVRRGGLIVNSNNQIVSADWPRTPAELATLQTVEASADPFAGAPAELV